MALVAFKLWVSGIDGNSEAKQHCAPDAPSIKGITKSSEGFFKWRWFQISLEWVAAA